MKMKGRKATAWIVGTIWLTIITILILFFNPDPAYASFFIIVVGCFSFLTAAFIGCTVWKDYIKSAHFQKDLLGK